MMGTKIHMINELEAKSIAEQYLSELETEIGEPLLLHEPSILEKAFGWVFFYDSKKYLETEDFGAKLLGNAPFIVDKRNGSIHVTGTAFPVEHYLIDLERACSSLG